MANTISLPKSKSSGSYIEAKIEYTQTLAGNNASNVTASLYVRKGNTTTTLTIPTEGKWKTELVIGNGTHSYDITLSVLEDWVFIRKVSATIPHNDDGTKSIYIGASVTAPTGTSFEGHVTTGGKTVTLAAIPQATKIDSLRCSTEYLDGVITAKYTPKATGRYHRRIINVNVNGTLKHIHTKNLGQNSSVAQQEHTMQFSANELAIIYDAVKTTPSATIQVTIQTFASLVNGNYSDKIGSDQSMSITLALPESIAPTAALTITPVNTNAWIASKDIYVAGLSGATATLTAEPGEGANLTSTTITYDGTTYSADTLNVVTLKKSGSIGFTGKATDSRGRSDTDPKNITVLPYSPPVIVSMTVERGTYAEGWAAAEDGPDVRVTFKTVLALVNEGNVYSAAFTLNGASKTPNHGAVINLGSGAKCDVYFVGVNGDVSHTLKLTTTDSTGGFGSAILTVPTTHITVEYRANGKGIAFGKTSEKDGLECGWDADFKKDVYVRDSLRANHIERIDSYDNKDFNDLVYQTGYYAGTSAPSAASCSNYPVNETGVLEVISQMGQNSETGDWWGFAYQTYRTHTGEVYTRSYYSSRGWTSWKPLSDIAEEGTSDIWTYRKYVNGIAECWGTSSKATVFSKTWGALYVCDSTDRQNYPFTFTERPTEIVTIRSQHNACFGYVESGGNGMNSQTQTAKYCAARPTQATENTTLYVDYHVFGRWK